MKRYLNVILVCCLALIMVGCKPKVIEPEVKKDPFVLGSTPMKGFDIPYVYSWYFTAADPLSEEILSTKTWVKSNQQVNTQIVLSLTDNLEYVYTFYAVTGRYFVVVKSPYYKEDHRYLVSDAVYKQIKAFLYEKYVPDLPGIYPFIKAMWGKDESTVFEIDPETIAPLLRTSWFTVPIETADLSHANTEFSLIDDQGNLYHFYAQKSIVEIIDAKDKSIKYFYLSFSNISDTWKFLKSKYADKLITNQLSSTLFTKVFLSGPDSFNASKLLPIAKEVSDLVNNGLKLNQVYKADVLPYSESISNYILKDDKGLYYVFYRSPYVLGVGPDPKGPLTYYSLVTDQYGGDINIDNLFLYMGIMPPAGTTLDDLTFSKAWAVTHSENEISVVFSSAQNKYLKDLMSLGDHAVVALDMNTSTNYLNGSFFDLFDIKTTTGLILDFFVDTSTRTIYITADYNGESWGMTYYRLDNTAFDKVMEAYFYVAKQLFPDKADASPTYDAFFIGDQLNYDKLTELPMTSLTSAQITTLDGLLQTQSWQQFYYFDVEGLRLKSQFVLRKDSDSFYIFSQYGSQSVVTDQIVDGESKFYIIPTQALNDVLNALKTMK